MNIVESFLTKNDCWIANVNKADARYVWFQTHGPSGLMLHSVGCAQPSADVFCRNWNRPGVQKMVQAFIDANTGIIKQTNKWNYRSWHCAGSGNNTHLGIEMCESAYIKYTKGIQFEVLDRTRAVQDCTRTYHSAVELFAYLAQMFNLDPMTAICSHKEGYAMGIASGHQDPEHYWNGLGMPYSMNKFRSDVKAKIEEGRDLTREETIALFQSMMDAQFPERWTAQNEEYIDSLCDNDAGNWSKEAREWAISNGLIAGIGTLPDGTPNYAWRKPLTREEDVQIRYRQAVSNQ